MTKGTVKWFDDKKGFGVITEEDGADAFVHHTNIIMLGHKMLTEGQQVEYDVSKRKGCINAIEVAILE